MFGVVIGGEARAYPRQIMEVREMVNDTLGGRDHAILYCTPCGSAQAYFTDRHPEGAERPILRTSGLLIRSNKVMYDIVMKSVFDTFLGTAVTGPLAAKGIKLQQAGVLTTTWGAWKREHPKTTVSGERLAIGRNFDFPNGRNADGPIFPIGRVDPRLQIQDDVVGSFCPTGNRLRFPWRPRLRLLRPAKKSATEASAYAAWAAASLRSTAPAWTLVGTRPSGSLGNSSTRTRSCGALRLRKKASS